MLPKIQGVRFSLDWQNERELLFTTIVDENGECTDIASMPYGTMFAKLLDLASEETKNLIALADTALSCLRNAADAPAQPLFIKKGLTALEDLYNSMPMLRRELSMLDEHIRCGLKREASDGEQRQSDAIDTLFELQDATFSAHTILTILDTGVFYGDPTSNPARTRYFFSPPNYMELLKVPDGSQGYFYEIDGILKYSSLYPTGKSLKTLIGVYLSDFIQNNVAVRKCAHCDRYFVPINHAEFCDRIADASGEKTCTQTGPQARYRRSLDRDPAKGAYRRAYKLQAQRKRNGALSEEAFEQWKGEAKRQLENVRNGTLAVDWFLAWLNLRP